MPRRPSSSSTSCRTSRVRIAPVRRVILLAVLAISALGADDAERLKGKAINLGRAAEKEWKRYVLERATFTDKDVDNIIRNYEQVIELYDLQEDGQEKRNRAGDASADLKRLRKSLAPWRDLHKGESTPTSPISERIRRGLEALGYVE